ncbi:MULTISPECIES: Rv1157c family protein [unclassified Gordonia (in: high G+C Gram-positive bacteria)]
MRLSALTRRARLATVAATFALAASLAAPAIASAAPAPAPKVDQRTLDSLGAFAPAIIGSVTTPGPDGKINAQLLDQARTMAAQPGMPPQVASTWRAIIDFMGEPGRRQMLRQQQVAEVAKPGEPEIPQGPNAPRIQEFLYPTLGFGCMPDGGNSLGRALVTAGPQKAPAPGPKRGQAGYVYTSLGTGPAINNPVRKLWVSWINIDNGRTGQLQLKRNPLINAAAGPGTFTGIATPGKGRLISTIYGDVTTKMKGRVISCTIVPTIGLAII